MEEIVINLLTLLGLKKKDLFFDFTNEKTEMSVEGLGHVPKVVKLVSGKVETDAQIF